ncbi:uncharacterized protein LOC123274252 isoform X2 [Cotesia glomerata]|uniref:uncharacterized protein LOC123274252 isoform X2 n=1 Tax=Cotesia glomerata TaxID=32391 RepID=UPI001D001A6B|nr:uncharacterized protein LOC123274252 isoform X2 [Cotesia glomerata]
MSTRMPRSWFSFNVPRKIRSSLQVLGRWFVRLLQLENVKRHSMSGFSVQMVDYIEEPGELIVDGQVVVKKKELNEAIYSKLE